ncbi:MAG TPA: pyridoxal phosphate-dependent aminotransferase [Streptosporangiaceae bacterium]|nr:pyridoxal phosphate-dependent aminotransferase [Streptosporangiaceae bacterium]
MTPAPLTALATLIPVSATLAANEALDGRRRRGQPVLPLAFGEAGLPVAAPLRAALSAAAASNGYGPVAGLPALRDAAAGYWSRRDLPTSQDAVVCGPGSKALIYGLLMAIGSDVAVPRPSWVTYAAQAGLIGTGVRFVPTPAGQGGVPDPAGLDAAARAAADDGRPIRSVILTLPDNPTGTLARPETIRAVCEVAEEHDLIIIADEIYRDLVHDPAAALLSPAEVAPLRTVVTTALSKSLAVGGWRIGVARLPDGPLGPALRDRLLGVGSEIWSAPAAPIQQAAAYAFSEPPEIGVRISRSRSLHRTVARAVADRFRAAGLPVPAPQAAFYLYPDFNPWREWLRARHQVRTGADLAAVLLDRYGAGVLPASAFGEDPAALRVRVATGLLYGDTDEQREEALAAADPVALPWIATALDRIGAMLADFGP